MRQDEMNDMAATGIVRSLAMLPPPLTRSGVGGRCALCWEETGQSRYLHAQSCPWLMAYVWAKSCGKPYWAEKS